MLNKQAHSIRFAALFCALSPNSRAASASVHMLCAEDSKTMTKAVAGPNGMTAALSIESHDDYNKDSHLCEVHYSLVLTTSGGKTAVKKIGYFISDGLWGRELAGRLDGFSAAGDQVVGAIYESAEPPPQWDGPVEPPVDPPMALNILFSYDKLHGNRGLSPSNALSLLESLGCGKSVHVIGTIGATGMVVEPDTEDPCHGKYRWSISADDTPLIALPPGARFVPLYGETTPPLKPAHSQR